jgi:hypothetical protein
MINFPAWGSQLLGTFGSPLELSTGVKWRNRNRPFLRVLVQSISIEPCGLLRRDGPMQPRFRNVQSRITVPGENRQHLRSFFDAQSGKKAKFHYLALALV